MQLEIFLIVLSNEVYEWLPNQGLSSDAEHRLGRQIGIHNLAQRIQCENACLGIIVEVHIAVAHRFRLSP
jgi:hypothetical protein